MTSCLIGYAVEIEGSNPLYFFVTSQLVVTAVFTACCNCFAAGDRAPVFADIPEGEPIGYSV